MSFACVIIIIAQPEVCSGDFYHFAFAACICISILQLLSAVTYFLR